MSRIGRNDPCHCGSGKKYKKCCLEADEKNARVAPEIGLPDLPYAEPAEPAPSVGAKRIPKPKSAEDIAMEALDEQFQAVDFSEKVRMLKAACGTRKVDDEMLLEWFLDLGDAAKSGPEESSFGECVDLLRNSMPEVYEKHAIPLMNSMVKIAVGTRRGDAVQQEFCEFARFAYQDFDRFFQRADQLAYHGFLPGLVEGFRIGWPMVREAKGIFGSGIAEYEDFGTDYETFAYLECASHPDPGNRELADRIRNYTGEEKIDSVPSVDQIMGLADSAWEWGDFQITRKAYRKEGEEGRRFDKKLLALSSTFLGWLHREKGMTYSKANLARGELFTFLIQRLHGDLKHVDFLKQIPFKDNRAIQNLIPDRENLDACLAGSFSLFNPKLHRGVAFMECIPHWLEYLAQRGLLDEDYRRMIFDALSTLYTEMEGFLDGKGWESDLDFSGLKQAWSRPG